MYPIPEKLASENHPEGWYFIQGCFSHLFISLFPHRVGGTPYLVARNGIPKGETLFGGTTFEKGTLKGEGRVFLPENSLASHRTPFLQGNCFKS